MPPDKAQPVTLRRFEKPPVIDGALDEDVWKQAAVFKDFYQTYPGDNIAPSLPTEVLAGFDGKFLYFAFRAHDEPGQVRATVAKRDEIFVDDNVGMYLDTFNDRRKAYKLYFNPVGVQADAIFTEGAGDDFSVDIVMESKGIVGNDGYTVEVAIPFKSLRYKAGKDSLWGVHFFRNLQRFNAEEASWMPINRDRSGLLIQAGHFTGLEGLTEERTLEIIPSLTVSETGKRIRTIPLSELGANPALLDPGRFLNKPIEQEAGATAKFGFASNLVLTLAVNPDFAQVEADETVITANQRFPIFFAEKRPFFLEGIENFQTSLNGQVTAVHTRAIIDPDTAIKLTGKYGKNSFGVLFASDNGPGNFTEEERENPAIQPVIERFIDKNAQVGILRLKRDIGKESSIGLIATTHNFVDRRNHVGGVDGRFRLDPQTIFSFQVLGTNTRRVFFIPEQAANIFRT
ncbi:MAG TPA: carbohydrate binding family 9 domain-containing protein, partial [Pyrinomonadaceae bacterium]|nr:carbohydrate binding family 9 domain-containing protein [Pyrinomonadaceae bacterium]